MRRRSGDTEPGEARRGGAYAWFVVTLLMLAFAFSMVDRMILSLLVIPLRATYGFSDIEVSLLQGLAFTLFYVTCGIPIGGLADRYTRTSIISWSIFLWSLMTAACAFTRSFAQLLLARAGVGVGEAGLGPAANSLIADYFPPERLAKPIALYSAGALLGPALAMIGGGAIIDYLITLGTIEIPLLGPRPAWQMTFVLAGLPGILLAVVFRFVVEPPRHGRTAQSPGKVRETLAYMWANRSFLAPHVTGAAFASLSSIALSFWLPTLIVRAHGLSPGEAGATYGTIALVGGLAGLGFGGWAADALGKCGVTAGHIVVPIIGSIVAVGPLVGATLATSPAWFFVLVSIGVFFAAPVLLLAPVALQIFVPNEKRGQVYAFYLLLIATMGYAAGPILVAFVTERVFGDEAKLGLSLALVVGCALPLAPLCFSVSLARYRAAGHP